MQRIFHQDLMRNLVLTKRQEVFYMSDVTPQEQVEIYLDTV
jgi:glutamine synthetase